jgi:hypothetical protein
MCVVELGALLESRVVRDGDEEGEREGERDGLP